MDNSVVSAGGKGDIRGLNGNGKNTIKIKLKTEFIHYKSYCLGILPGDPCLMVSSFFLPPIDSE